MNFDINSASDPTIISSQHHGPSSSMIYQVLPAALQTRMPRLPSIRRSIGIRGSRSASDSVSEAEMPDTPPPEYVSRPGSGSASPYRGLEREDEDEGGVQYEGATGISWQHARHGVAAIEQAQQQASRLGDKDEVMTTIMRSQYVHGLTLLLRSLPPGLGAAEQMSLRDALPRSVLDMHDAAPQALTRRHAGPCSEDRHERPVLWHVTAWLVFKLFLLVQLLLPYVKLFGQRVAQWEHEHQITRRAVNTGVAVGGGVGRECWRMSRAVCLMNDGMLGVVVADAVGYCAESIGGGIQQGIARAKAELR